MGRLEWDKEGEKEYEVGVKKGVLYTMDATGNYSNASVWNGLSSINESPSGAEPNKIYADDIVYANILGAEEFGATVEALMYPPKFEECDGTKEVAPGVTIGQQDRKIFGLSYVTTIGNDAAGTNAGYKIHLIYGCTAQPSEKSYSTINDSPEPITFSWEMQTTPVNVTGAKPTSLLVIDSRKTTAAKLKALEDILYGTDSEEARLPKPDEIIQLMSDTQPTDIAG